VTSYDVNSTQPLVIGENRVFVSAGYGHGAALVEVARSGDGITAKLLWQNVNMKNKFNSSITTRDIFTGWTKPSCPASMRKRASANGKEAATATVSCCWQADI